MSIRTAEQARQTLTRMLVHVERGELERATQCDLDILGFLKQADRDSVEIRALMLDLLAAYKGLKGKLSERAASTRDEIQSLSTARPGLETYQKVHRY